MASQLASIPPATRRRAAVVVGFFSAMFLAVGVIALTGDMATIIKVLGVVVLIGAAVLALITWGLLNSIRVDRISAELDAELLQAIAEHDRTCGCGTDHDPDEFHTTECAHDGRGDACAHDCDTCALAALRP